jgi:glycosyltransferase involved in cell wall biosynthesis
MIVGKTATVVLSQNPAYKPTHGFLIPANFDFDMDITYIITRSDRVGGAQMHVRDLAAAIQQRGHHVHVICGGDGPYFQMLEAAGLPFTKLPSLVRPLRPWTDFRCVQDLKRELRRLKPHVVHAHSSKAGLLGRLAAHQVGIPAVFSAHGWSFTDGIAPHLAFGFRIAERRAANWCSKILCGCEGDRQMGLAAHVGDESKIETVWYGIHNLAEPILADPTKQPPNMVMVARFEPQKDHDTLLRALSKVADVPWTLDLLGDGPLRPANEQLAAELGLADRIHFRGMQPSGDYLPHSQLCLLITNWEGLPLSTLEGMRIGLPLIGTSVGGIPEQITDGESGYLVPRGDVETLAERLRRLLTDPAFRAKMGRQGKQRFDKDFQYERMLVKVESVYEQAISSHKSV